MDEKKLLRMLKKQPNEALVAVLREYGGLLNGIALAILRDPREAEECVADGLVRLWETAGRVKNPRGLKSYLCAIVRNGALDRRRRLLRVQELPLQQELLEDYGGERTMDGVLLGQILTEALDSLGEPGRTILVRRYYQEATVREIAEEQGLSERAVESCLYRGRKKLKQMLSEGGVLYEA